MVRLIPAIFVSIFLAGCAKNGATPEPRDADNAPVNPSGQVPTQQSDWAAVEKLEAEARSMAKVDGCSASSDCATAAVGRKACGSPRDYLVYCTKTTNTAALTAKLDEVIKAETAYNQKYNVISTCEMRLAPAVEASGGQCRAR